MMLQLFKRWKLNENPSPEAGVQVPASAAAAARLNNAGRMPINIWGDVMLDGSPPQVRRVLTGQDAHESLLSFFYLAEVLTLCEVVRAIPELEKAPDRPASIRARFDKLKTASADPHNQLSGDEILQVFVPTVYFFKLIGIQNTELCELGSTFFSAIEKAKICSSLLDASIDFKKFLCAAVDHSDYFMRGAIKLHEGDNVVPYMDYAHWKPSTPHPFHLSRFVASYAVASTDEFAGWLNSFSAFHIIDVVNLDPSDFTTSNNGLRQIFFDFPKLIGSLVDAGWNVYLNEITPDFNSGRPCAVVKMFGIRREIDERISFGSTVKAHTDLAEALPMEWIDRSGALTALKRARDSLTSQQWKALEVYKKDFPIWGWTAGPVESLKDVAKLTSPPKNKVRLRFEGGQINYFVKKALGESS